MPSGSACVRLRQSARLAKEPADRQEVTRYLYSHPETFNLRLIPAPAPIDRDDVRLTLDRDEDWDHALTIYDALGPESLDWQRIATLLDHQPALRKRMAALIASAPRVSVSDAGSTKGFVIRWTLRSPNIVSSSRRRRRRKCSRKPSCPGTARRCARPAGLARSTACS